MALKRYTETLLKKNTSVVFGGGKERLSVVLVKYWKVTSHKPRVITKLLLRINTEQIFTQ